MGRVPRILGLLAAGQAACRDAAQQTPLGGGSGPAPDRASVQTLSPAPRAAGALGVGEGGPRRDPALRVAPPDAPFQRLALTRRRLAVLEGDELVVRRLIDGSLVGRMPMPGARNVVAVDSDFLVAGREHVYRLDGVERRAEPLPPVPRLGPTTILPSSRNLQRFWLQYEGIARLPEFELGPAGIAPYVPVLSWTELPGFDGRALVSSGDGTFVYTAPHGLRRVDPGEPARPLAISGLPGQVFRLLPASQPSELWALTPHHAHLLRTRSQREIAQRIELPPGPLAVASQGTELAVLALEALEPVRARLRVEVYTERSEARRVLRFDDAPAPGAEGVPLPAFLPEIRLAPNRPWVAVVGFGLQVYDWHTGLRVFPPGGPPATAQNLAPARR